jgi:hypothetical protein
MSAVSTAPIGIGKSAEIQSGERFPQIGETNRRIINAIKEMYDDPAVIFGRWLRVSDKTAKRKLGFERALSPEDIGVLIRSERGFEVLNALMGDAKPAWWRMVVPLMDAADAHKMQLAARRRLKKTIESALDADRDLAATIQRAEALAFHDEEHVGPHIDALRSMGGASHRSVAQAKGARR